jgi:peptide deformylase
MVDRLQLVPYPHPCLRRTAKPLAVPFARPQLVRDVVTRMFEVMYENRGIGLAATQVGLPWQIFVADIGSLDQANDRSKQKVFINPVLTCTAKQPRVVAEVEACLSLPNISGSVERVSRDIRVEALDLEGRAFVLGGLAGTYARVVQHEIDHLQGVLFIDHLKLPPAQQETLEGFLTYLKTQYEWIQTRLNQLPADEEIVAELQRLEEYINATDHVEATA